MVHFLFYAGRAYSYATEGEPHILRETISDGRFQENVDRLIAPHSAFSYEDLPSDFQGALFGAYYFNPSSEMTFGEQIDSFFNDRLHATSPNKAPNFNNLPNIDDGTHSGIYNHTITPMFTNGEK